jgi:hypothetical protein
MKTSKTITEAKNIIEKLGQGVSISELRNSVYPNDIEWNTYSSKVYSICLNNAQKERKEDLKKRNVIATSNKEISEILKLNEVLAEYALLLPSTATMRDFKVIKNLSNQLPISEPLILEYITKIIMQPIFRSRQKRGRIEKLEFFLTFERMIDAATLSYYRTNFISCYLTLVPIVEGIIIRWMGYDGTNDKPEFDKTRKFFKSAASRQPNPGNILFHNVYCKACDNILNKHFYKPTTDGSSHANFNRHLASHALNDEEFATQHNCVRLFLFIDAMTEIYILEKKIADPRFDLDDSEIHAQIAILSGVVLENLRVTAEHIILETSVKDLNFI